jgi:hypothetical protein
MVRCQPLPLLLALRQYLVQRLKLGRGNGLEKGLDDEGLDRAPVEMGTLGLREHPLHARADVARVGTIRHAHAVPTAATGREPLQ